MADCLGTIGKESDIVSGISENSYDEVVRMVIRGDEQCDAGRFRNCSLLHINVNILVVLNHRVNISRFRHVHQVFVDAKFSAKFMCFENILSGGLSGNVALEFEKDVCLIGSDGYRANHREQLE